MTIPNGNNYAAKLFYYLSHYSYILHVVKIIFKKRDCNPPPPPNTRPRMRRIYEKLGVKQISAKTSKQFVFLYAEKKKKRVRNTIHYSSLSLVYNINFLTNIT